MADLLKDTSRERVLVLHGQSGAGKSELGFEFARMRQSRYPGGTFLIRAGSAGIAIDLAGVGKNILGLQFPADLKLEEQGLETFHKLGSAPTLLVYDNVMSDDEMRDWLPPAGMPCHVIVTTVVDRWHPNWPIMHVHPLPDKETLDLVETIGGPEILQKYGQKVVEHCQGLPIQIVPLAETLTLACKRGLDESVEFTLSKEGTASFAGVYNLLDQDQKLLLHAAAHLNPQRILRDHLFRHLLEPEVMKDREQIIAALNACMDLTLLQGSDELRMHQLMADFVLGIPSEKKLVTKFWKVRKAQAEHLVELARRFRDAPADTNLAAQLTASPISIEAWLDIHEFFSGEQAHPIGHALSELGQWGDALPWYVRAVKAREAGDKKGRVDHDKLAASVHGVGHCYSKLGKFQQALPWFERAVEVQQKSAAYGNVDHNDLANSLNSAGMCFGNSGRFEEALPWHAQAVVEAEKGDKHGTVNYAHLGIYAYCVGFCYSSLGKYEEALTWYERAVKEKEIGDIHGKVDHESLGTSLNQLGSCYWKLRKYEEALPWFERAVAEVERGDIHGRVDDERLQVSRDAVKACLKKLGRL
jgi:tetratricopeptide (TPR) repeat protein